MSQVFSTMSLDNPLFGNYLFYSTVLIGKTVFMSFWIMKHRVANKALPLPEDYKVKYPKDVGLADKANQYCEPVERVRRAHLNDLENIPMFLFASLLYLHTNPCPRLALWHLRIFTIGRILHSLGMLNAVTRIRGIGFGISTLTMISVIGQVMHFAGRQRLF